MNLQPLAVLLALTLPLAACGNKGPLVRPGTPVRAHSALPMGAPASSDTTPPAEPVPPADSTTPPADAAPTPPAGSGHG
ncbi:MAG: sugar transporter [Lysobacter sp.]|nr:sugar transporter [Lysobacter sp.]